MAALGSKDVCGVSVPEDGVLDKNGRVNGHLTGGQYVVSVLWSSASEAQKVEALHTAGIQSAKELSLQDPFLTGAHVKVLAVAMEGSHTLTVVSLGGKHIGDAGVEAVVRMAATTPALKKLSLNECGMTATGAKYMASWLAGNPRLERLSISHNPDIGDDGLTAVAEGLQSNSALADVLAVNCGMTVKSAAAWADLLQSCTALRRLHTGGMDDDEVTMLADGARAHRLLKWIGFVLTKMTDRGMRAVADMAACHPSLEMLVLRFNGGVTDAGWAALSVSVRSNTNLALKVLVGVDLAKYDDTLPDPVVKDNLKSNNKVVLSYYRAQSRICRRVAAVAMLRTAWHRSHGRPVRAGAGAATQPTRAAELAHMVQLRRICRVREGKEEVVEPFGRSVVAYL